MENKVNIAEILKLCPPGMKLNCTMYDNVFFDKIDENIVFAIRCYTINNGIKTDINFTSFGTCTTDDGAKCVIFPEGKTTWKDFVSPCNFKDGDIVSSRYGNPFILKATFPKSDSVSSYCALDFDDNFQEGCNKWASASGCRYATEEEKQKLFDAIRENGYKWNNETKTLEKLIVPKFKVGDKIKYRHGEIIYRIVKITEDTYKLDNHHSIPISLEYEYMYDLVPNKFDISSLKPFDKVLVWDGYTEKWNIDFFGRFDDNSKLFKTMTGSYSKCIPYECNEHLFDTDKDCIEYYKIWE